MSHSSLSLCAAVLVGASLGAQVGEPGDVDYTPELPPTATYPIFTDIAPTLPVLGADFDDVGSGRGQVIADLVGPDPSDPTNPLAVGGPDGIPDIFQSNSNSPALPLGAAPGTEDVVAIGTAQRPCLLLRGASDGTYTDVAPLVSPSDPNGYNVEYPGGSPWGAIAFDYDSDGDLDLYHANGGFNTNSRNTLNRNGGDGTFENVATAAGLTGEQISFAAVALDYDRDGDLDLYVANGVPMSVLYQGDAGTDGANRLYENDGAGGFVDVAPQAECDLQGTSFALAAGDLDRNGWQDLYVSCYKQLNKVFYNAGDGTFAFMAPATNPTKVMSLDDLVTPAGFPTTKEFATEPGPEYPVQPERSMPLEIADINGDRWPDLLVVAYALQQADDNPDGAEGALFAPSARMCVYLNRGDQDGDGVGDGMFREAAAELGLDHIGGCMCLAVGDYNGDGLQDVYLGGGGPNIPVHNEEDYLFISEPTTWPADFQQNPDQPLSKCFWEVGALAGTYANKFMSHGANPFFDDGRMHVVVGNGGPAQDNEGQSNVYWRNTGNADGLPYQLTQVRLEPQISAVGAAGATIELVRDGDGGAHQTMVREVGIGSRFGSHSAQAPVFGLGQGGLLWGGVRWPSGARQGEVLWALNPKPAELTFVEPEFSLGLDAAYPGGGAVDLQLTLQEFGASPRLVALTFGTLVPVGGGVFLPGAIIPLAAPVLVSPGPAITLNGLLTAPSTGLYLMVATDVFTGEILNVGAVWHEPALSAPSPAPATYDPGATGVDLAPTLARATEARERIVVAAQRARVSETGRAADAVELTLEGRGELGLATGDLLRWRDGRVEVLPAGLALVEDRRADGRVVVVTGQAETCCETADPLGPAYIAFPPGAELLEADALR